MKTKISLTCILVSQIYFFGFEPQVVRKCDTNLRYFEFSHAPSGFRYEMHYSYFSNRIVAISINPIEKTTNWITETTFNDLLRPVEEKTLNAKKKLCSINRIRYDKWGYPLIIEYEDLKPWFPKNFSVPFSTQKGKIFFRNDFISNRIISSSAYTESNFSNQILSISYSNGALFSAKHYSKYSTMTEYFDSNGYPNKASFTSGPNIIDTVIQNEYDPRNQKTQSIQIQVEKEISNEVGRNRFYYK